MTTQRPQASSLDNPLYYLENFRSVLSWVLVHHADLLTQGEVWRLQAFEKLPHASQALLVRMVMRKGDCFRVSRLHYPELGVCVKEALQPLLWEGWVESDPLLSADTLFSLFTKAELASLLRPILAQQGISASVTKGEMQRSVAERYSEPRRLAEWCSHSPEPLAALCDAALFQRMRLMFFGNLHQGWSEFVLTELGHQRYEYVPFSSESRAFQTRGEVDRYLHLQACREALQEGEDLATVWASLPQQPDPNPWLERRRARLLFSLGQAAEREQEVELALSAYAASEYPEALVRRLRLLERAGEQVQALSLAMAGLQTPQNEHQQLALQRLARRVAKRLGETGVASSPRVTMPSFQLTLSPEEGECVEHLAAHALAQIGGPVFYVENSLFNSLFGLLCWEVLFAPLPGAFFHPFQAAPADLFDTDFVARRRALFEGCLATLDNGTYRELIRRHFEQKRGISTPFVDWALTTEELLQLALTHIPSHQLKVVFDRMLGDLRRQRAGLPDLIQFLPDDGGYRLIEVKAPGDRLQDNQRYWFHHMLRHQIPVTLCRVEWVDS